MVGISFFHSDFNSGKDYLLAACSDSASRCERRCQYVPDIFQQLVPMRDEVERESSAVVRFEVPDNQVLISGQERNILAAQRFLDLKAQDIVMAKSKGRMADNMGDIGLISQVGTQSREVFRQGRNLESEDSSYDSDCEVADSAGTPQSELPGSDFTDPHHDDVSRTVSDTLGAEFAEYITRDPVEAVMADPNYTGRVEFALKLGYTEKQVQTALQKLGPQPSQNELLAELIRLGASSSAVTYRSPSPIRTVERTEDTMAVIDHFDVGGMMGAVDLDDPSNLRHIVIDGSNVAMSHGNKEVFSCRGIQLCVDWFRARGHQSITVFVPRWRKESSRPDAPCTDQEILAQLEKERKLVFTPSRHVGGRRLVCYDDRYILRLAVESDGIVVSNDNYRDLANESPEFKKIVEDRLLMFSFVNDRFMPPDDPLGRHGPSLDNFLRKSPCISRPVEPLPPPCPYGKKCTYGNKCKYHHPERGNLPQKSVTERLAEQAKIPLQEVKSRGLKSRESSPGDKLKSSVQMSGSTKARKQPLSRTKSLVPSSALPGDTLDKNAHLVERTKSDSSSAKLDDKSLLPKMGNPYTSPYGPPWSTAMPQISLTADSSQRGWATTPTTLPHNIAGSCAEMFLEPDGGGHLFVAKRLSDPDNKAMKNFPSSHQPPEMANLHRKLQRQLTLNPSYDPRLVQLGGYVERSSHPLVSPPQDDPSAWSRSDRMMPRSSSQENMQLLQSSFGHVPLGRMGSDGGRVAGNFTMASPHVWDSVATEHPSAARLAMATEHQTVTRIASAPDSCHQWPPSARMQHLNSTSDTRLNLYPEQQHLQLGNYPEMQQQQQRHWLSQSHGLDPPRPMMGSSWQDQSPSGIARGTSQVLSQPVRPSSVPPPGLIQPGRPASPDFCDSARHRLYFHLASIFPKEQVQTVMELYPQETNPQKICAAILNMFPKG